MGIFYDTVPCLNRSPIDVTITFDGQSKTLPANKVTHVPKVAIAFGKNQNPVMGSQSIHNPHISGAKYLIADLSDDDTSDNEHTPMTEAEWLEHLRQPQRINAQEAFEEKYAGDPKAKLVARGVGRRTAAGSVYEAGRSIAGASSFEHDPR
jgi:hypothetical protein